MSNSKPPGPRKPHVDTNSYVLTFGDSPGANEEAERGKLTKVLFVIIHFCLCVYSVILLLICSLLHSNPKHFT